MNPCKSDRDRKLQQKAHFWLLLAPQVSVLPELGREGKEVTQRRSEGCALQSTQDPWAGSLLPQDQNASGEGRRVGTWCLSSAGGLVSQEPHCLDAWRG